MNVFQIVGIFGAVLVLYCYLMTSLHMINPKQYRYYVINFISAVLMLVSLYDNPNLGSILIEVFLLLISVIGYIKTRKDFYVK